MRNALPTLLVIAAVGGCVVHASEADDFVTLDPKPEGYAWWMRARFHPFETQVRGIRVQEIKERKVFYDSEIVPALLELCRKCKDAGLSF